MLVEKSPCESYMSISILINKDLNEHKLLLNLYKFSI